MSEATSNTRINIYINNEPAKRALVELEAAYRKNAEEIRKLTAAGGDNAEALAQLRTEEERLTKAMDAKRREAGLHALTYKQLRAEYVVLLKEFNSAIPGTAYRKQLEQELKAIRQRMNEVEVNSKRCGSTLSQFASRFNQFAGVIAAGAAAITGLSMTFRRVAQDVAHMDDVYADVMKTTNKTRDEVVEMNEELKKMDTRTSREELNLLMRDAGKLGKQSRQDILGFVEAGNQIRVALGEDLGEDAIKNIGKIVDLFKQSQGDLQKLDLKGQMLAIGSAINELGMSSTASEPYMVAFAGRMGGVAAQAKISIQNVLGFASALDQNMQAVEMSATALSKFIMKLYEDPAKFAKLAGKDVQEFTALLNKDANGAIKQVLTALNEKGGFQQLVPVFQKMGLDGARAVQVLSSLAGNIGKVNEAQGIANRAFAEGTSVTNEYDIKNNNLQARLEKAQKAYKEAALALGEHLNPALLKSTNLLTYVVRVLPDIIDWFKRYSGVLISATATVVTYVAAAKLHTFWVEAGGLAEIKKTMAIKAKTAALYVARTATLLYTAAVGLLTGNITMARRAFILFSNAIKANPIGLAVAALVALGAALHTVWKNATEVSRSVSSTGKEIAKATLESDRLFDALAKTTKGSDEYNKILKIITDKYPAYLQGLIDEKGLLTDIEEARKRVTEGLQKEIATRILQEKIGEKEEERIEEQVDAYSNLAMQLEKQVGNKSLADVIVGDVKKMVKEGKNILEINQFLEKQGINIYQTSGNIFRLVTDNVRLLVNAENKAEKSIESLKEAYKRAFGVMSEVPTPVTPTSKNSQNPNVNPNDAPTSTYEIDHKAQEEEQAQFMLLLKQAHAEEKGNEEEHQEQLQIIELKFLKEKLDLQKKYGEETVATETAIADKLIALNKSNYTRQGKLLDEEHTRWLIQEKEVLEAGQQTEEEFQLNSIKQELKHLQDKLKLAVKNGQNTLSLEQQIADKKLAIKKHGYEQEVKAQQAAQQLQIDELQAQYERGEISAEFYQQRLLAIEIKGLKERLAIAKAAGKDTAQLEAEITKKSAQATKELNAIRKKLFKSELEERRDMELQFIKDSHKAGLLSDKQYARESLKTWSKYAADKAKLVGDVMNTVITPVGNAIKAFEDAEIADRNLKREQDMAALTEDYNAKMAAAEGNYEAQQAIKQEFEDQKAQIDYQAASDNLDTQKKYADANFAIQATQAVITGIISAMQAFSAMASIPYVGPALGAVAAAAVGVTTAMQIQALNAERQRIKSVTLEAPGSSKPSVDKSTTASFSREVIHEDLSNAEIVPVRAKGKYDVISEDDGREYRDVPLVQSVTGVVQRPTLVAEEPELVVGVKDFPYLRKHINYPLVIDAINDARDGRTVPARARGEYGSVTADSSNRQSATDNGFTADSLRLLTNTLGDVRELLAYLKANGVEATAYYVATEAEKQQKRLEQSRKNAK